MKHSTTAQILSEDSIMARLLALALDKVQKRRTLPKKQGRLHRV